MKSDDLETVLTAVEVARRILGEYIEPGRWDATSRVNRLLATLDDQDVVKALIDCGAGRSSGSSNRRTCDVHRRPKPLSGSRKAATARPVAAPDATVRLT